MAALHSVAPDTGDSALTGVLGGADEVQCPGAPGPLAKYTAWLSLKMGEPRAAMPT